MENTYRRVTRRFTALLAIASLAALLFVAAPASAATTSQLQGYTPSSRIEQRIDPKGKLPFTGLDVLAIAAVGGVLLAVGVGVRKLSTNPAS